MDQNEMSNLYRGSSIDASYQVSLVSFGQAASEEKLFLKLTNKKQAMPVAANRRFCIEFPQSRMKGERHMLSTLSL
jgi:hypothetical protein